MLAHIPAAPGSIMYSETPSWTSGLTANEYSKKYEQICVVIKCVRWLFALLTEQEELA